MRMIPAMTSPPMMSRRWMTRAVVRSILRAAPAAAAVSPEWARKWREDLGFVATELPKRHVNLFHTLSEEEWHSEISGLSARVGELDHHEIAVELARIIARIGDGHTRLTLPLGPGIEFMQGHSSTPHTGGRWPRPTGSCHN